jgi:hypothetical protein
MSSHGGSRVTFRPQVVALAKVGSLVLRGRQGDAAEALLRSAYSYRDGGSAWDAFPEQWRQAARDNARATLVDFRNSIGNYPSATELATVEVPVVCSYGARSPPTWSASPERWPLPSPRPERSELKGPATPSPSMQRPTSCS